jgi:hypothetical protein
MEVLFDRQQGNDLKEGDTMYILWVLLILIIVRYDLQQIR